MMNCILENRMIEEITRHFTESPYRVNSIHEADAELIDLGKTNTNYLAITTDALVEEVTSGMYDDPYLIGWMLATVNYSDLAAVGARPMGIMVSINYPSTGKEESIAGITTGINDACKEVNAFVLGGDTNQGNELFLSGCAIGLVPKNSVVTRLGTKPNDRIYLSGPAGLGSVFAYLQLTKKKAEAKGLSFQPTARIKEGEIIRKYGNACMDTSDGVFHTVDTMMRINKCRFILNNNWEEILHPATFHVFSSLEIPPWCALTGVHGEFELCFTVSPEREEKLLAEASNIGWHPILIGEVSQGEGVCIRNGKKMKFVDTAVVRNFSDMAGSEPDQYIQNLIHFVLNAGIE